MKIGTRLAALGGVALAGALSLTACGTDDNGGKTTAASGDCVKSTVNAAGSTAQANAMSEWIKGYQQSCPGSNVNYNGSGSGAGVQAFTGGQVAFGSDSALKPEEHGPADARCKSGKALDLPMVGGPIAIIYNLKGVDGIQLSPKTLASIFAGKIKTWNDPAIAKDNSGVKLLYHAGQAAAPLGRLGHDGQPHQVPARHRTGRLEVRGRQDLAVRGRMARASRAPTASPPASSRATAPSATPSCPTPPTASCRPPRSRTAPASTARSAPTPPPRRSRARRSPARATTCR